MYENNNYGQYQPGPGPNPYYQPAPAPTLTDPEVEARIDAAFGKSLAATIMAGFPIASIIAISFGSTGLNMVDEAKRLAAQRGAKPGGKNVAATVLGKIGKIGGIVMTAFWGFYFFILMIIIMGAM